MKNYISPSYELENVEAKDIITASSIIEDNGEATYQDGQGNTVTGNKGTFSGNFSDLYI